MLGLTKNKIDLQIVLLLFSILTVLTATTTIAAPLELPQYAIEIDARDLAVRPGAVLLFADKANLIVTGSLTALGTEEEPIQFTAQDESDMGLVE